MSDAATTQLVIRHTGGGKVNKIDQFQLGKTDDISLGRDASSSIAFDGPRDDVVSRRHAVIRVKSTDPLKIIIEDLGSSNGTLLNGERIAGEREILPDDTVELGSGGPKFVFDVQPRPASLASRTRVLSSTNRGTKATVADWRCKGDFQQKRNGDAHCNSLFPCLRRLADVRELCGAGRNRLPDE